MSNEKQTKISWNSRKGIIAFWSIVLIVVSFYFLKNAGFLTSVYLSTLFTWPLILFILSIVLLIHKQWVFGIVVLATAKFFLLSKLLAADPELFPCISADGFVQRYWYILVAFIAVVIIIQHIFVKESPWERHKKWRSFGANVQENKEGYFRSHVVFSSNEKIYLNENFTGGRFETVFGSQEIDLRKCIIPTGEKAYINLSVVFGSCEIWIPAEWKVQINTKSVFSSLEDRRMQAPPTGEEILIIDGECVFSSLEIRS
jgi:predicted membrane protein